MAGSVGRAPGRPGQFGRCGPAPVRVGDQRSVHHLRHGRGHVGRQPGGGFVDPTHRHRERVVARERSPPGQAFEGHHPEGVDVTARRRRLAQHLLWSQVGRRTEDRTGLGQLRAAGGQRDAEVGQRNGSVGPDQQVGRFDVPVHDAAVVHRLQRLGGLGDQVHRRGRVEPAEAAQRGGQRFSLDVLHHQVGARLVAMEVVDRDDAGVLHARHRAGLDQEPPDEFGVVEQFGQHDLHRDGPAEHEVGGPPHLSHATRPDALVQPVPAAERLPGLVHPDPPPDSIPRCFRPIRGGADGRKPEPPAPTAPSVRPRPPGTPPRRRSRWCRCGTARSRPARSRSAGQTRHNALHRTVIGASRSSPG